MKSGLVARYEKIKSSLFRNSRGKLQLFHHYVVGSLATAMRGVTYIHWPGLIFTKSYLHEVRSKISDGCIRDTRQEP